MTRSWAPATCSCLLYDGQLHLQRVCSGGSSSGCKTRMPDCPFAKRLPARSTPRVGDALAGAAIPVVYHDSGNSMGVSFTIRTPSAAPREWAPAGLGGRGSAAGTSVIRISSVAQAVAKKIEGEHRDDDVDDRQHQPRIK